MPRAEPQPPPSRVRFIDEPPVEAKPIRIVKSATEYKKTYGGGAKGLVEADGRGIDRVSLSALKGDARFRPPRIQPPKLEARGGAKTRPVRRRRLDERPIRAE